MTECIERETAKAKIREKFKFVPARIEINEVLNSIPAADVRPVVKAEWLPFGKRGIYGMMYACSFCHAKYDGKTNFCPNCGAEMEES